MRMGVVSSFTVTLALLFSAASLISVQAATFNDTDVLNFALNLEVRVSVMSGNSCIGLRAFNTLHG